jgi:16S rRNA processing protein RimM
VAPESFPVLTLARLLRPWGRRGEVAAEILTDFPQRLAALRQAWLADGRNPPRPVNILSCRLHGGQAVIHFEGVSSINDAEKLRGLELQVPLSDRASLPPGRHYISDLIGCAVWEENAAVPLGTVREVRPLGAPGQSERRASESWLLAVETAQGELLIPLAAEICTRLDTAARRIDVRLPEGLRDLNQ